MYVLQKFVVLESKNEPAQSAELERALKEIEQLKEDHEVARDKRDKQVATITSSDF